MRALRASLESIKQVIQGVHDDLVVSKNNYKEITGMALLHTQLTAELQEKWTGAVDQVGQTKGRQ